MLILPFTIPSKLNIAHKLRILDLLHPYHLNILLNCKIFLIKDQIDLFLFLLHFLRKLLANSITCLLHFSEILQCREFSSFWSLEAFPKECLGHEVIKLTLFGINEGNLYLRAMCLEVASLVADLAKMIHIAVVVVLNHLIPDHIKFFIVKWKLL